MHTQKFLMRIFDLIDIYIKKINVNSKVVRKQE